VNLDKEESRDEFELRAQESSRSRPDLQLPVGHLVRELSIHDSEIDYSHFYDGDYYWDFLATTLPCMPKLRSLMLVHPHVSAPSVESMKDMPHLRRLSITIGEKSEGIFTLLNQLTHLTDLSINILGKREWRLWPSEDYPTEPPLNMPNVMKFRWREDEFNLCDTLCGDATFRFFGACRIHPRAAIDIEIFWVTDSVVSDILPFFQAHNFSEGRLNFSEDFDMSPIADELVKIPTLYLAAHMPQPHAFFARRILPAVLHLRVLSNSDGSLDDLLELLDILADSERSVQSPRTKLHLWYSNTFGQWSEDIKLDYKQRLERHSIKLNELGIDVVYEGPVEAAQLALQDWVPSRN
jgi:hypothetical protein